MHNLRICIYSREGGFSLIGEVKFKQSAGTCLLEKRVPMVSAYIFLAIGAAAGFLFASVLFSSRD